MPVFQIQCRAAARIRDRKGDLTASFPATKAPETAVMPTSAATGTANRLTLMAALAASPEAVE